MRERSKSKRVLLTVLDVPVTVTAQSWLHAVSRLLLGIVVGWLLHAGASFGEWLAYGLLYGVLFLSVQPLHLLGHVLGSRMVAPPMNEARITPLAILTLYRNDPAELPGRVHLIRSLGGPLMNILVGTVSLLPWLVMQSEVALVY